MIFVDDKEKKRRLEICTGCKFFKESTGTCGTIRLLSPLGDKVKYRKKEYRLCGCIMQTKTRFKAAKCPVGKWNAKVDEEALQELKEIVSEFETKGRLNHEQGIKFFKAYNDTFDASKKVTTCSRCLQDMVKEIKESIREFEN